MALYAVQAARTVEEDIATTTMLMEAENGPSILVQRVVEQLEEQ